MSDITPASLYMLPNAIRPTLLIDEFEPGTGSRNRVLEHYLRCGSTQDGRAIRGGKLYDTFCPKVISFGTRLDFSTNSALILIP